MLIEMAEKIDAKQRAKYDQRLLQAVVTGSVPRAKRSLAAGANPNVEAYGGTPLHMAVNGSDLPMVKLLLKAGADPDDGEPRGWDRPLAEAVTRNRPAIAMALLRAGARPEWKRTDGNLLVWATHHRAAEVVDEMLRRGAAAAVNSAGEVREWNGVGLQSPYGTTTALIVAARLGEVRIVRTLLRGGADMQRKDSNALTALQWAEREGHGAVVKLLRSPPAPRRFKVLRKAAKPFKPSRDAPKVIQWLEVACGSNAIEEPDPPGSYLVKVRTPKKFDLDAAHRRLLKLGWYLFDSSGDNACRGSTLEAMPTTDKYAVIEAVGTDGQDVGGETEQIIAWLKRLEREQPFVLTGIGHDFVSGRFTTKVKDATRLARRINKFSPDVVIQGHGTVAKLAESLKSDGTLFLWWD
jgi:ankyrin repeat protein